MPELSSRYAHGSHDHLDKQRLKEAVWRVQGIVAGLTRQGRMPMYKFLIVDSEVALLARAVGVDALDALDRKP